MKVVSAWVTSESKMKIPLLAEMKWCVPRTGKCAVKRWKRTTTPSVRVGRGPWEWEWSQHLPNLLEKNIPNSLRCLSSTFGARIGGPSPPSQV